MLYLNIRWLRKDPEKFFMRVLESLRKFLDFLSVKEWEPCFTLPKRRQKLAELFVKAKAVYPCVYAC